MKRVFSRIASLPITVTTSGAGSNDGEWRQRLVEVVHRLDEVLAQAVQQLVGLDADVLVDAPRLTECTIPLAAILSSVEYTFEDGRPADLLTSLPFCGPCRSRPTYTLAS